jgi:hypothetical protein
MVITELVVLWKHLGVYHNLGNDESGPYLSANMLDFIQGIINIYKKRIAEEKEIWQTPSATGQVLTKIDGEPKDTDKY